MIFISYSKSDIKWREKFVSYFNGCPDEFSNKHLWYDEKIATGAYWLKEIEYARTHATIAILLVSKAYLASDFIKRYELDYFLIDRKGSVLVYWFLLEECAFKLNGLSPLQCANVYGGELLEPLNKLKGWKREKVIAIKCEEMHYHILRPGTGMQSAGKHGFRTLSHNLVYKCNRSREINKFKGTYYKSLDRRKLCFSIEGEKDDRLTSFHKSIIYNGLLPQEIKGYNISEKPPIDIAKWSCGDLSVQDALMVFQVNLCALLKIEFNERVNIKAYFSQYRSQQTILVIPIVVASNVFKAPTHEKILDWLFSYFANPVHMESDFSVIFLVAIEYSGEQGRKNKDLKKFFDKKIMNGKWHGAQQPGDDQGPMDFHMLGTHGLVAPEDIEAWYNEHSTEISVVLRNKILGIIDKPSRMGLVENRLLELFDRN